MRQLYYYLDGLQRHEIIKVGISLGLNSGNLSDVNPNEIRAEMIRWWLDQRDNVSSIPTLQSLIDALKYHGFNRQVRVIQEDIGSSTNCGMCYDVRAGYISSMEEV